MDKNNVVYKSSFSLIKAYQFLKDNGLEEEANNIKITQDQFMSYTSTLRRAKIIVLVTNQKLIDTFIDEIWPSGKTKKGLSRIQFFENLYQRFIDDQEGIITYDGDEEISPEETQFAYENDLKNYIANNLKLIEDGLNIYVSDDGKKGIEYHIQDTQRRIDILAKDKTDNFVVIELKVSRGHEKTIGQALYYQSLIKKNFNVDNVRVIIIAREISEELKMGTMYLDDFKLFEYQLSFNLNKI